MADTIAGAADYGQTPITAAAAAINSFLSI